jgi:hypothetical protein
VELPTLPHQRAPAKKYTLHYPSEMRVQPIMLAIHVLLLKSHFSSATLNFQQNAFYGKRKVETE